MNRPLSSSIFSESILGRCGDTQKNCHHSEGILRHNMKTTKGIIFHYRECCRVLMKIS